MPYVVDVAIDGLISYSGAFTNAPEVDLHTLEIDGFLMPGLTNWHSHAPMIILRGLVSDVRHEEWLRQVWSLEASLSEEDIHLGALAAFGEMMLHGITSSVEMYFHDRAIVAAAEAIGFRCCVTPGINESPTFRARFGSWSQQLQLALSLDEWVRDKSCVSVGISVHSPYAVSESTFRQVGGVAIDSGRLFHFHLAELPSDVELRSWSCANFSDALRNVGADRARVVAAHGVYLSRTDWLTMSTWNSRIALCPRSNLKLGVGLPSVPQSCRHRLARFGTDGSIDAPIDILKSAEPLVKYAGSNGGSDEVWAWDDIMRTCYAPEDSYLGFNAPVGRLSRGYAADVVALEVEDGDQRFPPSGWIANRISDVWIGGRRVVAGRKIIGVEEEIIRAGLISIRRRLIADR